MSTSAGIKQYTVLDDKFGNPSAAKMHRIIADGGDLFGMMAEADLSLVDREAFRQLLFSAGSLTVPWTPVGEYPNKIRAWNKMRGWGLTEKHIGSLERRLQATPHAGDLLPTGITLTIGNGVEYDWNEAMACLLEELIYLNRNNYGISQHVTPELLSPYPGSEPKRGPYIAPAKLDLQEFYGTEMMIRDIRASRPKWPGTEILWLLALNPQVLKMMSCSLIPEKREIPGLIAAGLAAGKRSMPRIDAGHTSGISDYDHVSSCYTVVSFRT